APGSLEKIESMDPFRLVFRVPLRPTAELGDYKSLRQPYEFTAPGDDELEQNIQVLRQMYGTTQAVERPIQAEDFVLIDLIGKKVKPKDGEEAVVVERKGHAVYVAREPRDDEYPYKGFAHELIGLKTDDKKTITHKFGKDVKDEALRGATVEYEVTVKSVRMLQLPELDDEFARMTGLADTLAELRQNLRQDLEQKAKDDYDDQYFSDLLEKIRAQAMIKYPPQLVDMEVEEMLENLKEHLKDQGLDFETFLKIREVDEEKFIETEVRPAAIHRLESRLIIDALIEAEKVDLDPDVLRSKFDQTWNELVQNNKAFNKATKGGGKRPLNLLQAVMLDVASRLLVQEMLERLKSIASGQADDERQPESGAATKTEPAVGEADAAATEASGGSSDEPV
ncbi:MAG: trigger factor, partial [Candidatus Villigracilaceae bacterium]